MSLRNMTVGRRIGLGFAVVLVLLAGLAGFAYTGVSHLLHEAEGVTAGNKLDGTLAQREVDHLIWSDNVSKLLTDPHATKLEVETDDHQCGLGKWLYGEERKAAVELIPPLAPLLTSLEEPHRHLHESAIEIGKLFKRTHEGLRTTLADRIQDHMNWVAKLTDTMVRETELHLYKDRLEDVVDQAASLVEAIANDETIGSEEARKERALTALRSMRYGADGTDYIWVNDTTPRMVMHPINSKLEGQEMGSTKDTNGKLIFVEMVKKVQAQDTGFVVYYWPHPTTNQPTPKLSYVRRFPTWDWIIGSGIFVEGVDKHFVERMDRFAEGVRFELGLETDPTQCAFGKFLVDAETIKLMDTFPEFKLAMDAARDPHDRLHQAATHIEEFMRKNELNTAVRTYEHEVAPALAELKGRFDEAIVAESELRHGLIAASTVYAEKTKPALAGVRDLLHKTREKLRENIQSDEVLVATAQATNRNILITGGAALVIGVILAVLISRGLIKTLTRTVVALREGAEQVNDAAGQVSSASQSLAEGASEQASSLEETSSALEEMAAMTRTNAESAKQANGLSAQARSAADNGDKTMTKLNSAMTSIDESSTQISKIIKVIEEIAFQTNLLALNAAVEAARAGEHGKGFAVVADEVRNLAQRAAQAARETTGLIEDSVQRVREGTQVANEVTKALGAITGDVTKVSELIHGIATASEEQSRGVDQINTAVSQMDKVTQQNASGAEESASAAEELAAQAESVKAMVNELAALVGGSAQRESTGRQKAANHEGGSALNASTRPLRRVLGPTGPQASKTAERSKPKPATVGAVSPADPDADFLDMDDKEIRDF